MWLQSYTSLLLCRLHMARAFPTNWKKASGIVVGNHKICRSSCKFSLCSDFFSNCSFGSIALKFQEHPQLGTTSMVGMHTGSGNPCGSQSQLSRVKRSPKKSFHLALNWMAEASPTSYLACISIVNKWFCLIFQLLCSSCNHQQAMISQKLRRLIWLLLCHLICK